MNRFQLFAVKPLLLRGANGNSNMNYNETIGFLYDSLPVYHRIGKAAYKANLENTIALDEYFGHPHTKFKTIHVAGTNGKGSVSHMLASIFQEAGIKTALYTSPHLKDFRERLRVNGEMIPEDAVVAFVADHMGIITTMKPSFFELTVAMAFDWFARSGVEVAIIETGLGGRLDSTNIITPELSVITNIGLEHTNLLGDTLEKIAFEKAGIIKEHVPVVIGESHPETTPIFVSKAGACGSDIMFADKNFVASWTDLGLGELSVGKDLITSLNRNYLISKTGTFKKGFENENIIPVFSGKTPFGGDYQLKNLSTLAQSFVVLKDKFCLKEVNFVEGVAGTIKNTGLMGRWQILSTRPLTICDAGHNYHGLKDTIRQLNSFKKKTNYVLGFSEDKDIGSILPLFPVDGHYYFTRAAIERAMDPKKLANLAMSFGLRGDVYGTVAEAYNAAKCDSGNEDLIFIGGSIFVIAEII